MSEAIKHALLPCPFCGGAPSHSKTMDEDIWSHNTVPWRRVRCGECEIGTDYVCEGYEPSEVEAWNRRSNALVERVKELEEALQDAVACGMVPKSSAADGGASKYSEQVLVADRIRAALSKSLPNTVAEVKE